MTHYDGHVRRGTFAHRFLVNFSLFVLPCFLCLRLPFPIDKSEFLSALPRLSTRGVLFRGRKKKFLLSSIYEEGGNLIRAFTDEGSTLATLIFSSFLPSIPVSGAFTGILLLICLVWTEGRRDACAHADGTLRKCSLSIQAERHIGRAFLCVRGRWEMNEWDDGWMDGWIRSVSQCGEIFAVKPIQK